MNRWRNHETKIELSELPPIGQPRRLAPSWQWFCCIARGESLGLMHLVRLLVLVFILVGCSTPAPAPATPTLDEVQFFKDFSSFVDKADTKNISITDVRLNKSDPGSGTDLHIEVKCLADKCREAGLVTRLLTEYLKNKSYQNPNLSSFSIVVRDSHFNPQQTVSGAWQDLVDYVGGHIDVNQFTARVTLTP